MKALMAGFALTVMFAGCASTPDQDSSPTMQEVAAGTNTAGQDGHQMTGSRLKDRSSTDRMLKAVGAQGAKDEMRNAPRPGAMVQ